MHRYSIDIYYNNEVIRRTNTKADSYWEAVKEAEAEALKDMPLGSVILGLDVRLIA